MTNLVISIRSVAWCGLLGLVISAAEAADQPREKLLFDSGWKFTHGDPDDAKDLAIYPESDLSKQGEKSGQKEAEAAAKRVDEVATNLGGQLSYVQTSFDDGKWREVHLPHDWAIELPFKDNSNTVKGSKPIEKDDAIGWYRRTFTVPASDKGRTVAVEFGGAYRNTLVWINGHCLGRMASGYTPFYYDVTRFLNYGQPNVLVARVDASANEGWFYEGAGLYRHVWMIKTSPVHVAHWGTYVTSKVTGTDATVSIETTVENSEGSPVEGKLTSKIFDEAGTQVGIAEAPLSLEAGKQKVVKHEVPVSQARLWSPETPHMYRLVSTVEANGQTLDTYATPFGIRTVEFTGQGGFSLNGVHRFIKGVCNHQDFAGVGVAVPDRIQEYRVKMLREMGCDGWRMSHNPPNEELLDECDRQGMMVMDENRRFGDYAQPLSDLKALMLRDRNHPSIVIWSLGNEEMGLQGSEAGAKMCKTLQDEAHQVDPSRLCTLAINHGIENSGFTTVLDVTGMNYKALWGGMDHYHEEFPDLKYITTEEASLVSTRGLYFENARKGYLTAYDTHTPGWGSSAESWWSFYNSAPSPNKPLRSSWVAGGFAWTGFDYRGEPTPYGWPCISSHFGILDTCGFPKDDYYYYKAWWTSEPVLHLYPHWNWNQVSHRTIALKVTAPHCQQAELWTGKSKLGSAKLNKNGEGEFKVYDEGDLRQLQIILQTITRGPDPKDPTKTKDVNTMVARQDFPVSDGDSPVNIEPLKPEDAGAVTGSTVAIRHQVEPIQVWVQSNQDEVELFVNGTSQGKKQVQPMHHLEWSVEYAPGTLSATAYKSGKAVKTETIETTNASSALRITANRTTLKGDGEDVALVKVEALDDKGRFVPTASDSVHFEVKGAGRLIGVGNGDPSCHESDLGPDRSLFNGLALGVIQAGTASGSITVTVSGTQVGSQALTIPVESASARPSVP